MDYAAIQQAQQNVTAAATGSAALHQQVTQAIRTAAAKTGVSFSYLLNKAAQESGGDPNAKASTSTATGLFQFTGQTWLRMVKTYGTQFGAGNYAEHIQVSGDGTAHVSDPAWKKAILGLRNDPQLSAEMAGELDKENNASLRASVGGKIGPTELYLAHFLGAGGASDFIQTLRNDPSAKAASILPDAAEANSSVFYDSDGNARSVAQIYQHFARRFDSAPANSSTMLASAAPVSSATLASASVTASSIPPSKAVSSYAAMGSYMVADAGAARSAYAASAMAQTDDNGAESSAMLATMLISQMKADDMSATSSSAVASAYNKRNAISMLGAIT